MAVVVTFIICISILISIFILVEYFTRRRDYEFISHNHQNVFEEWDYQFPPQTNFSYSCEYRKRNFKRDFTVRYIPKRVKRIR